MNCINKLFWLPFLILFFVTTAYCDVKEFKTDKTDITIGENISIDMIISIPGGATLIKPEYDCMSDWYIKNIYVKKDTKDKKNAKDKKEPEDLYSINMIITTFKPKTEEIPPITFSYIDSQKKEDCFSSKPVSVKINSIKTNNVTEIDKLKDIKNVKKVNIVDKKYVVIFFIFAAYFIFLLLLFIRNKHKQIKEQGIIREKNKMIDRLNKMFFDISNNEDIKTRYLKLSDIVFDYLKAEYAVLSRDVDTVISQLADFNMPLSTFKVFSTFLKKIRDIDKEINFISKDTLDTDINNLKIIISKSVNKKG